MRNKKRNMQLLYDPVTAQLGIYLKETKTFAKQNPVYTCS